MPSVTPAITVCLPRKLPTSFLGTLCNVGRGFRVPLDPTASVSCPKGSDGPFDSQELRARGGHIRPKTRISDEPGSRSCKTQANRGPTMRSAPFLGSLADLGAQSNHICGQHLSRANPRGPSLVIARPIHPTNRSDIVLVRCRSIIWHLTGHFTSISGQSAGIPCTRAIGRSIRRLTISLCSQRTWPSIANCSDE